MEAARAWESKHAKLLGASNILMPFNRVDML